MVELSDLHRAFAEAYLRTMSIAAAYREVSESRGMPVAEPGKAGWAVLQREDVQEYLQERRRQLFERNETTAQEVLNDLRELKSVTIPDVMVWDEESCMAKPSHLLTDAERKAIKRFKGKRTVVKRYGKNGELVSQTETFESEVEIHDRMQINARQGMALGLWEPDPADQKPKTQTQVVVVVPAKLNQEEWNKQMETIIAQKAKPAQEVKVRGR